MESKAAHHDYGLISLDLCLKMAPSFRRPASITVDYIGLGKAPYPCDYCTRKFLKKQALGGHQRAHRLERTAGTRKCRRRQIAPSSSSSSSPEMAPAVNWIHAGGGDLWRPYDPAASVAAPVVDWTEAAAAPEDDLTLKLWSG